MVEKENMSMFEGVAKDMSKLVSIPDCWEGKKSSSFCMLNEVKLGSCFGEVRR